MDWQAWRIERAAALPRVGNIGVIEDVPKALAAIQGYALRCPQCVKLGANKGQWAASWGGHELPVMLVGESPGWEEAREHRYFVGPAGKALNLLLASVGLPREKLWLTNTVRCRCPKKSDLTQRMAYNCSMWLGREAMALLPSRIVLLGRFAWEAAHGPHQGALAGLRKQWRPWPHHMPGGFEFPTTFMYHPAAGLRDAQYLEWLREDLAWLAEGLGDPVGVADFGGDD